MLAPELDPEPKPAPELPLELEPMPGHECFPGGAPDGGVVPVFAPVGGVAGAAGVVVEVLDVDVEVPVLAELAAAVAAEIPPSAPPLAIAPAIIVAPSSFDLFMRSNLHLWVEGLCRSIVRHEGKWSPRSV
jgi:hypothetical protein